MFPTLICWWLAEEGLNEGLANGIVQVFLNIVLDDAVEEKDGGEKVKLGMVVRCKLSHKLEKGLI